MSVIRVHIDQVMDLSAGLKNIQNKATNVSNGVSALRYSVDSAIAERRNIASRLSSTAVAAESITGDLWELEKFIKDSAKKYSDVESKICKEAEVAHQAEKYRNRFDWLGSTLMQNLMNGTFPLLNNVLNSEKLKLIRFLSNLPFETITENNNILIRFRGNIRNNSEYQAYRGILTKFLGGTAKWDRTFVAKLINEGVPIYRLGANEGYFRGNSNKFANSNYDFMKNVIKEIKEYEDPTLKLIKDTFKENINVLKDFDWRKTTTLTKVGKLTGIAGTGLSIYESITKNMYDPVTGEFNFTKASVIKTTLNVAVDVGSAAGAMTAGAMVGSLFVPPLGTVVGMGAGLAINYMLNWDALGNVVGKTKEGINYVVDNFDNIVDNSVDAINNAIHETGDFIEDKIDDAKKAVSKTINDIGNRLSSLVW